MALTTNVDIDYVVKDYNSTVDSIISFANIQYGPGTSANRLWTSFNLDSFSRNWLEIVAYISDIIAYYFDTQATQAYLQTATVQSFIELIAEQFGYTIASNTSASGIASFTTTSGGTIPRGFQVSSTTGQTFYTTNDTIVIGATTATANVLQGQIVSQTFVAQGLQSEEFILQGPNVVIDLTNSNTQDISPQLTVNGNSYTLVDSFINSNGTNNPAIKDSLGNIIGGGGRVFTLSTNSDGSPVITFGNGTFGRQLQSGEAITIGYRTGGGSAGNIPAQTLTSLVSSLPFVSSVTNAAEFSGGADAPSIDQVRNLIPASLKTLERAVAASDYSDILLANFSQVFAASTEPNTTTAGVDINIYVVPQGTGIPKITDNPVLLNTLSNFIDIRKMVTTQFQILNAYGVDVLLTLEVHVSDTASQSTVSQDIQTALANFFSLTTGGVSGSGIGFAENILVNNIADVIETVQGIDRFEIRQLSYRPRIADNVVGLQTTYNNSEVTIFPNVSRSEWLLAASGTQSTTAGITLFSNTGLTAYTYNSGTGTITYAFPVDLSKVSPGDNFKDGVGSLFSILAVDTVNSILTLSTSLTINNTVSTASSGSVLSGGTSYNAFKCFKKILCTASNLSISSITDNTIDLSIDGGTAVSLGATTLLDNTKVYIPNEYSTGKFYLVDSANNIWNILSNESNIIKTSFSAVNDGSITTVAAGAYKIVPKLTASQVVFQSEIFEIDYNSHNTFYSIDAEFNQIGTIGDSFEVSTLQNNIGNLGVDIDVVSYNPTTGVIILNGAPDLTGVSADSVIIDSSNQILNVVGVNNVSQPTIAYTNINQDSSYALAGTGVGQQIAEGFKVTTTDPYAIVSFNLQRQGNATGNLIASIVNDSGGLPNLSSVVATSNPLSVATISNSVFQTTTFSFATPPTLTSGTQYHLVLASDALYQGAEQTDVTVVSNTGLVGYSYSSVSGILQYAGAINLTAVVPGNYFQDSAGNLFEISSVNTAGNSLALATGIVSIVTTTPTLASQGSVIANDNIIVGLDSSSPTYTNGQFSRFDGALWSNSTLGPHPSATLQVAIFAVQGTKTITIQSNLTPATGPGATLSTRYYDDNNEVSFIIGLATGYTVSAADANALGKGTVDGVGNRPVDNFVFRTSPYADDIVNLRLNEIPQISSSDIQLKLFNGIT